jgi:hypothetical protein
VSNGDGNKREFERQTGYDKEFTPEETEFLKHLDPLELQCLIDLRDKERRVANQVQANSPPYTPVVPYSVGPKAY